MCNCRTTCNNCATGLTCGCPPDYSVTQVPLTDCKCCPQGYTFQGPTPNYPNGTCISNNASNLPTDPIPCTPCVDTTYTDCVLYNGNTPLNCAGSGISAGDNLNTIITKLCPSSFANISAILSAIALNQTLLNGLCNLVGSCGSIPGSSTPIIGPISFSIP